MDDLIKKADILVEALPYMRKFRNKTIVIKYGGNAMVNDEIKRSVLEDITLLKYVGVNPVIVHGGGPVISETLDRFEIDSEFYQGLRVTTEEIMEIVEMVLVGKINKEIVSLANAFGSQAIGICGKDGNLIEAESYELEADEDVDLGYVGQVKKINSQVLDNLIEDDFLPIVSPIGVGNKGESYNINADLVAGHLAAALDADKLILLTNVEGILADEEDKSSLISSLNISDAKVMMEKGRIAGGMIPKVNSCINALEQGVRRTHILDGRVTHALLLEIFTDKGIGTMVTK
ncbi:MULTISPECIES: acetylglutamate kinase [unclassified Candidatus Frackibacter]|uniref:acetylglutamate kinase n=1 Tax=unclassified Candidatus Frackibacter TaxID=2648818 RepID=UPI000793A3B4|nr:MULTISPECIES: acetylglutamate kinase [unclassified Candidatus Frackibacter]KXS41687.1 MAG: acetylglutamate kinase [Candidatus Frackibacter sp. T328-2]SDB97615.1 N-acetylglutamate kinase [Candidatus Frackibacter sp. WG11]SEM29311.1 N-acetylglutamate kinase [Candidatus Frackibacter sp. WG12]SFL34190.1 N-acetylglutamate kinase [Candidatus Frackibacter sp. WG13]